MLSKRERLSAQDALLQRRYRGLQPWNRLDLGGIKDLGPLKALP
jgi:hypothetical protein